MVQSITITQMDSSSNEVSRLGLEGINGCSKILEIMIKNTQVKGLRLVQL